MVVYLPLGLLDVCVQEYQRKQLLERIDRDGATIGKSIPEEIQVDGSTINLHEFVFEITRRETIPPGKEEQVTTAKKNLRRAKLDRRQTIESGDISYETADRLADEIIGIDRALESLENLGESDIEAEAKRQQAADRKRWMRFLRQALGRESDGPTRR